MSVEQSVPTQPPPEILFRPKLRVLGVAWAVLTPLALMVVFTVFFQRVAKVDTGGAPYALFAYLGLLPWTFFSTSVNQGGQSLILNIPLLNKVAFPREVFPIAYVVVNPLAAVIDGYRRTVLFGQGPRWDLVIPAAVSAFVVIALGFLVFKRM